MKKHKILICTVGLFLFLLSGCSYSNNDNYNSFKEQIEREAVSANILLIELKYENSVNSNSVSELAGASGVIYKKEGEKYFALTAFHVVSEYLKSDTSKLFILAHDEKRRSFDTIKENYIGMEEYYALFPMANIEYYDEKYDLAVISFTSSKEYTALPLSSREPQYNDVIATISNPHDYERNKITIGKITSKKPLPFGDQAGKLQYNIIEHSAKISLGSSGSVLLNKSLEIVGINLGGSENILRQNIRGKAMPSDKILEFLRDFENSRS